MKKYRLLGSCVVALAAITTPPVSAASETKSLNQLIPFSPRPFLEIGMKRETVVLMLGQPSAKLSPDKWVYFDFRPGNVRDPKVFNAVPQNVDTAIVMFENGRVIEIRLCDSKPVRAFLAKLECRVPPRIAERQSPALRSPSSLP